MNSKTQRFLQVNLENGQCKEKVVPDCTKVGEFGVLPSSDNHYYVCVKRDLSIHAQILICPNGWHFWDDGYCRPEPRPLKKIVNNLSFESKSKENTSEETTIKTSTIEEPKAVEKSTTTKMDAFFSTEKTSTYAADTFLADKFDLANYESTDDIQPNNDFFNSYENEWNF